MSPKVKLIIKKYLPYAGIAVLVVAVIIIITSLFQRSRMSDDYYKQILAAKDQTITLLKDQRVSLQAMHADVLDYARQSDQRDSIILIQILDHQKKYLNVNKSYAQIPDRINRLSNDMQAILAEFRNY